MRPGGFSFLLFHELLLTVTGIGNCPWSQQTVEEVDACPTNKTAVELRKKMKNCEMFAIKQNCTDPKRFSYHCLTNEYGNTLVEVCAPVYFISGYCAEYNTVGQRIQPHYILKCSDVMPPCGKRYISTDAYMYEGCYAAVQNKVTEVFGGKTELSSTDSITTATQPSYELKPEAVAGIIVALLIVTVAVPTFVFIIKRRRRIKNRSNEGIPLMQDADKTENMRKHLTEKNFEKTLAQAKLLWDTVQKKEEQKKDHMKENEKRSKSYLEAYIKVNKYYVDTGLTMACEDKLNELGIAVLIGQQGSGKTSTAVHIMSSDPYTNWTKRKITSWEDILVIEFKDNTFVYIDNLFDGFMYQQEADKWLDSLCYFYFECVKPRKSVRLIITAKKNVIEKAYAFMKSETKSLFKACAVIEDSFPLSVDDKRKILDHQIKLAKEIKGTDVVFDNEKLKLELLGKKCPLGFPLCAHMYAFEKDKFFRDKSIFESPRSYVRNHIHQEMEKDETNGVKTLFLFLIFYHYSKSESIVKSLDLTYYSECKRFLKGNCSEMLIEKIESIDKKPLHFENLYEKACELEDTVLIKHYTMFEFKHQIYLEGVSEYFFRKYFDAVVDHFPSHILREYELHDNSPNEVPKLVKRIKEELKRDAHPNPNPEALKWKVCKEPRFKEEFRKSLQNESPLIAFLTENGILSFQLYFGPENAIPHN